MNDEAREYVVYLSRFNGMPKPTMPQMDPFAYTESEYVYAIESIMRDYENLDDEYLTIKHIKGE